MPSSRSTRTALRAVSRAMPNCCISVASEGSTRPGGRSPDWIRRAGSPRAAGRRALPRRGRCSRGGAASRAVSPSVLRCLGCRAGRRPGPSRPVAGLRGAWLLPVVGVARPAARGGAPAFRRGSPGPPGGRAAGAVGLAAGAAGWPAPAPPGSWPGLAWGAGVSGAGCLGWARVPAGSAGAAGSRRAAAALAVLAPPAGAVVAWPRPGAGPGGGGVVPRGGLAAGRGCARGRVARAGRGFSRRRRCGRPGFGVVRCSCGPVACAGGRSARASCSSPACFHRYHCHPGGPGGARRGAGGTSGDPGSRPSWLSYRCTAGWPALRLPRCYDWHAGGTPGCERWRKASSTPVPLGRAEGRMATAVPVPKRRETVLIRLGSRWW